MTEERYPVETVIDKSDFDKEACQRILDDSDGDEYYHMYEAFSKAARKSIAEGNPKQAKIYWLLSDACSMILFHESKSEPFKPFAVFDNRRSAVLDDFSEEEVLFFSAIISDVTNLRLKARLADLAWSKAPRKDLNNALAAIDAYTQMPIDAETWISDGCECWYRALDLVRMLKSGAGDRITKLEAVILDAFSSGEEKDGYFSLRLADLMANFDLGRYKAGDIAVKLESLARTFEDSGNFSYAQSYFDNSSRWYQYAGNAIKSIDMIACRAEAFIKEATARAAMEPPNNIAASSFYEKAIQIFRTIPRKERGRLGIDRKITRASRSLREVGELSLGEMEILDFNEVSVSGMMEIANRSVSGKPKIDALKVFANLSRGISVSEMEDSVIEQFKRYPLRSLFSGTYLSRDGRVIAKTKGTTFGETLDRNHPNVQASVIQNHGFYVALMVHGSILPALGILHLEHKISEIDFIEVARRSSIIPPGREIFIAKGLFAGYEYDYITALHLLLPQIENLVRYHLKNAGAKTSTLDNYGIESENGLSTLVDLHEMKSVFGDDRTFEIKALFCESFGPNLRNEIAHGLVDHNDCNSIYGIYAWWFALKLTFNAFWNIARKECESQSVENPI